MPKKYLSDKRGTGYMKMMRMIIYNRGLSAPEKLIYTYILDKQEYAERFNNTVNGGYIDLSISRIAEDLNLSSCTVKRGINRLVELKLVMRWHQPGTTAKYQAHFDSVAMPLLDEIDDAAGE